MATTSRGNGTIGQSGPFEKIFVTIDPSFIGRWQKHSFIDGSVFDLMTYFRKIEKHSV
jgi:hypothetical protein